MKTQKRITNASIVKEAQRIMALKDCVPEVCPHRCPRCSNAATLFHLKEAYRILSNSSKAVLPSKRQAEVEEIMWTAQEEVEEE